jgi:hypothetical protein
MKISLVSLILLTVFIAGCTCPVTPEEPTPYLPTPEPTPSEPSAEYALQLAGDDYKDIFQLDDDTANR